LPYDVYSPETVTTGAEKPPILLLDDQERLMEISEKSEIIRSIAGLQRGKYYLYYPEELARQFADKLPEAARNQLHL